MFAARNMMIAGGGSYDADAATYFAAIATAGSSISAANKTAVNAFVVGCKADGIWTAIKASCLLCAADDLTGALVPLVGSAPTNNNFVSGDYSRTTGLKGNGTTKNLNSNRANNADPQNNAHIYCRVSESNTAASHIIMGTANTSGGRCLRNSGGSSRQYYLNSGVESIAGGSVATGGYGTARSSSPSASGIWASSTETFSEATVTQLTTNIHIFGSNGITNCNARLSFYSIGESLDLALLDARLTTLMAALT